MSITAAQGFAAAGIAAGIKSTAKADLALVVNQGPRFDAAAVFTSNRVVAAPVIWSRRAVADGVLHAVVLNSGGANACTGAPGLEDAAATAKAVAQSVDCEPDDVAVCSTGLIGVRLPMAAVLSGIAAAADQLSADGGDAAAHAIMTTDTVPKQALAEGEGYTIGGMAKGAGMLAPALATMLVVITTDAEISAPDLQTCLQKATALTFDRIDSDGCMSTNDTVLALASGASGTIPDLDDFTTNLARVCWSLARQLIGDAEGASHDIAVEVTGAASEQDALEVAREIARSNLFKCAIFGNDPNWGRVLSAIGVTSAAFEADELDVTMNGVQVCRAGGVGDPRELVDLTGRECQVLVDLHAGEHKATIWTNDLTYGYVKENAEYSS
ncbi:MAG: bifunctional glutamate N-acetyltransferase/amino-acid acetyltransferase ArgJ [Propionibacterium sp.]|uniref:Arginine biosynthesis bifunctional protein ArgJ n=1 Tax=Brooklawnia propionicigenes TaxID=3041175 RepID=A0AAN0KGD1_9ACTN|nr:bifunctional glutamate N-acetyltransferase/amino-acid acetyltransferase ArgJ [Brooklawnia sp. SH051]MEA5121959.1 bifunctional glutamate N-acetyltransferase/amino-acid acetyltransferase ArgJ [Propionibacterium sp.]NLI83793.1 bifunctional glutamate N-acetyltransferase/amino-acid acetyltransferase ArgJ [Propionibacterium sp.]BEH01035.1 bifunctional glutamate N-acetyltransferase/amino-acid acetyltransferase ArgJ [Brooklawnia sp. SH051]